MKIAGASMATRRASPVFGQGLVSNSFLVLAFTIKFQCTRKGRGFFPQFRQGFEVSNVHYFQLDRS